MSAGMNEQFEFMLLLQHIGHYLTLSAKNLLVALTSCSCSLASWVADMRPPIDLHCLIGRHNVDFAIRVRKRRLSSPVRSVPPERL